MTFLTNTKFGHYWGIPTPRLWQEIDANFRTEILAEAGAGKTREMQARAQFVQACAKV